MNSPLPLSGAAPVQRVTLARAGIVLVSLAWLALLATTLLGLLQPFDNYLRDVRFRAATTAATGQYVFVDIDASSLAAVAVWPWPRSIHARALDELMRLGAAEVVFDIDFSLASIPSEDAAFERALEAAGGFAMLAAFRQQAADGSAADNLPLPRFLNFADPVGVNVRLDNDGIVRSYPLAVQVGGRALPSVAAMFAHVKAPSGTEFSIDYSIDPQTVPRIAIGDLLAGKVPADAIAGKQIVVGASAVELRDFFVVPRHGILPGALLQIMAAETLQQGRALLPIGPVPLIAILMVIASFGFTLRRRMSLWIVVLAAIATSALAEVSALLLQMHWALLLNAAVIHAGVALMVLQAVAAELHKRSEQRRAAEERLRYLGTHDPVTGTFNRTALVELAEARLARGDEIAVVILDIRRFRAINDTLGHAQGDLLLQQVVARLRDMGPDTIARLGADVFAMVVPDMVPERLEGYCRNIAQFLAFPYNLANNHEATIAASAGATTSQVSGRDPDRLLRHADMALSVAKQSPGSKVVLFDPAMDRRLQERQAMDTALHAAMRARNFTMVYQPQIELATGRLIGVEALTRWTDEVLGIVPPTEFVPAAEETGLIVELGRWTLETACREAARWPASVRLAVNVSPVQFELSDVAADVSTALERSGLDPARLDLEITEGVFVRNAAAVTSTLEAIRASGVGIALDDFGTGYSSLGYLGKLPLDKIKIDQSFVFRLPDDAEALAIIRAVLALGQAMGKAVVAEGIETEAQADLLRSIGCDIGQGYFFARPMLPEQIVRLVAEEAPRQQIVA